MPILPMAMVTGIRPTGIGTPQLRLSSYGVGSSLLLTMAATTRPAMAMAATTVGMACVAPATTVGMACVVQATTVGMACVVQATTVGTASAVATASALVEWAAGAKPILRR